MSDEKESYLNKEEVELQGDKLDYTDKTQNRYLSLPESVKKAMFSPAISKVSKITAKINIKLLSGHYKCFLSLWKK